VIDLHSHILPDIDDGARSLEDALGMARAAVADGITTIAATPHVRVDYPTSASTMERAVGELRAALADERIGLELLPGGEIALDSLDLLGADELARFGLGGSRSYVLLEFPYEGWPVALPSIVLGLRTRGITPVIAHPERSRAVQADPARLRPIALSGALCQLTAASLDGRLGRRNRDAGFELLERGLAQLVASDAHTPDIRGIGMSGAVDALGDPALARWLTETVPAAIVAGEPVPPKPVRTRRPSRLRGFLRAVT
jgi:protein-tyrosine phosphatase